MSATSGAGHFLISRARIQVLAIAALFLWVHTGFAQATESSPKRDAFIVLFISDTEAKPVAAVEVTLEGRRGSLLTDSTGRAVFLGVRPGDRQLHLRRMGFQQGLLSVSVPAGERVEARGIMTATPHVLEPVVQVNSAFKPARYARTTKFDDFYHRRAEKAGGTFITRDDIDRRQPGRSMDLFYNVPGIRVIYDVAHPSLSFSRCKYGRIAVFVDGMPAQDGINLISSLHPNQIEAIEIYHGLATVPPQFIPKPSDCAAIIVWTKY